MTPYLDQHRAVIVGVIGAQALADAEADARAKYPNESCGFVARGQYVACINQAEKPTQDFKIADQRYTNALVGGTLQAIIHSHPGGPIFPSAHDMQQQIATAVPWVIIALNETTIAGAVAWGDQFPKAPIIGRPFVHGVFDCYSLIRDTYALGAEGLKAQGIKWPLSPIKLAEFPRDDNWWQGDADMYVQNFKSQGFSQITRDQAKPGDMFLIALGNAVTNPKKKLCHGGLLTTGNLILHHLPGRLSRRDPAGVWARVADLWIRHEAAK